MVNPFVRLIIHRSIPLSLCLLVCPLFRQLVRLSFRSSVGLFPRPSASLSAIIPFVHPFLCGRSRPWVSGTSRVFDSKQYDEEELIESTVAENRLCSNSALLMESFQMSLHSLSKICACVRVWWPGVHILYNCIWYIYVCICNLHAYIRIHTLMLYTEYM